MSEQHLPQTHLLEPQHDIETEQLSILDRARSVAHTAIESVRGHGREITAIACGTLALGGAAEAQTPSAASAQGKKAQRAAKASAHRSDLEQKYNAYVARYAGAPYVYSFNEYFIESAVIAKCGSSRRFGEASYKLSKKSPNTVEVSLERKSAYYAVGAVLLKSPTPGENSKPIEAIYASDCKDFVNMNTKIQLWQPGKKRVKGKVQWKRVPGSSSVTLPEWTPETVKDSSTNDPSINPELTRTDKVSIKMPRKITDKDVKDKKYYPVVVNRVESKLGNEDQNTGTVLGPLQKSQRTVNAGTRWFGKGGAYTTVYLKP